MKKIVLLVIMAMIGMLLLFFKNDNSNKIHISINEDLKIIR